LLIEESNECDSISLDAAGCVQRPIKPRGFGISCLVLKLKFFIFITSRFCTALERFGHSTGESFATDAFSITALRGRGPNGVFHNFFSLVFSTAVMPNFADENLPRPDRQRNGESVHLAFDRLDGSRPERAIAFLHGILGRGINLRTIARRFVEARPGWTAWLV